MEGLADKAQSASRSLLQPAPKDGSFPFIASPIVNPGNELLFGAECEVFLPLALSIKSVARRNFKPVWRDWSGLVIDNPGHQFALETLIGKHVVMGPSCEINPSRLRVFSLRVHSFLLQLSSRII